MPESPPLERGQILQLADFKQRSGLGKAAWLQRYRKATGQGFKLASKVGNRVFVCVDQFYEYLQANPGTDRL